MDEEGPPAAHGSAQLGQRPLCSSELCHPPSWGTQLRYRSPLDSTLCHLNHRRALAPGHPERPDLGRPGEAGPGVSRRDQTWGVLERPDLGCQGFCYGFSVVILVPQP